MLPLIRNLCLLTLFISIQTSAADIASRFRVVWSEDPATMATIGFDALTTQSNYQIVYREKGSETSEISLPISDYRDHKSMRNSFSHLKNLTPSTAYEFYIELNGERSKSFWFRTAPASNDSRLSLISGGDSRNNREVRKLANIMVSKLNTDAVLFGGDMTGSDNSSQWKNWFNDWQLTISEDGRITPIVPTRGNHERSNDSISKLFAVPSQVYYALDIADDLFRVYTLNTESSISGNQTLWLKSDLEKNGNRIWKFAQYHRPIRAHTSGKSEGNRQYKSWAPLFYEFGVNLVSESDSHTVKTTFPIRPSKDTGSDEGFIRDDERGTVYVGEGCWGAPLRRNNDDKNWTRASGRFNQFKLIYVDKKKIELRTIAVDNAREVGVVEENDRFTLPSNLKVWNPENGSGDVITLDKTSMQVKFLAPQVGEEIRVSKEFTVQINATDSESTIKEVQVFGNGKLIHRSNKAEFSFNTQVDVEGDFTLVAIAKNNNEDIKKSRPLSIYIGRKLKKYYSKIDKSSDDGIERNSGRISLSAETIHLGDKNGDKYAAFLFRNLPLIKDSEISKAYIQFTSNGIGRKSTRVYIQAAMLTKGSNFKKDRKFITDLEKTTTKTKWDIGKWTWWGKSDRAQRTPNLNGLLHEAISKEAWSKFDSLMVLMSGSGDRRLRSRDKSSSDAPRLFLEFK